MKKPPFYLFLVITGQKELLSKIYGLFSQYITWKYSQPVMPVKTGIQKTAPRPLTLDSAPVFTGVRRGNDKTKL